MKIETRLLTLPLALSFCLSAAFAQEGTTTTQGTTSTQSTTATQGATAPTDPEIAHIVVTANKIDIENGNLAKRKTKNPEVKAFAQQMITDHKSVNKQATDLTKRLHVKPQDNSTSESLMGNAKENASKLKKLKGKDFDKEYVDQEVTFHQAVLDTIDQTLIPNAKNDELKNLITKVRPSISAHLEHAKSLQSKLSGSSDRG